MAAHLPSLGAIEAYGQDTARQHGYARVQRRAVSRRRTRFGFGAGFSGFLTDLPE